MTKILEVGKSYKTRGTDDIWEVIRINDSGNFDAQTIKRKFVDQPIRRTFFSPNGHFYSGCEDEDDLIIPQDDGTHLDIILAIAQGKQVEVLQRGMWTTSFDLTVINPVLHPEYQWRLYMPKKMIKIGNVTIVAPEREPLEFGTTYYTLTNSDRGSYTWHNDDRDKEWLVDGQIFLTREDAKTAFSAIIKLLTGK